MGEKIKKHVVLISVGVFNFIHGITHILQFAQSVLLLRESAKHHHHETLLDKILHHPIVAFIWAVLGVITLIIGIKEYIHHKKCKH